MKDINYVRAMAQNCIEELNAIGIYPNITPNEFTINGRLKNVYGRCFTHWDNRQKTEWHFTIEMSARLLGDNVPEKSLRIVTLHELLHACDECVQVHHGGQWKTYAELVSDCYAVDIKRCGSDREYGIENDKNEYKWKCSACGQTFTKKAYRAPKWYMHPKGYTHKNCPCGKGYVMSEYYGFKLV